MPRVLQTMIPEMVCPHITHLQLLMRLDPPPEPEGIIVRSVFTSSLVLLTLVETGWIAYYDRVASAYIL